MSTCHTETGLLQCTAACSEWRYEWTCSAAAVIASLAQKELSKYGLTGWLPTFVTDAGGNVRRAMAGRMGKDKSREGGLADWGRCACHMLHNVVSYGFSQLRLRAPTNHGPKTFYEAVERCVFIVCSAVVAFFLAHVLHH